MPTSGFRGEASNLQHPIRDPVSGVCQRCNRCSVSQDATPGDTISHVAIQRLFNDVEAAAPRSTIDATIGGCRPAPATAPPACSSSPFAVGHSYTPQLAVHPLPRGADLHRPVALPKTGWSMVARVELPGPPRRTDGGQRVRAAAGQGGVPPIAGSGPAPAMATTQSCRSCLSCRSCPITGRTGWHRRVQQCEAARRSR